MNQNVEAKFDEVDLRTDDAKATASDTPKPHSTSRLQNVFNSAIRKTLSFTRKKRRVTTPVAESDLIKSSISGPSACREVVFSDQHFEFSRKSIQCCPFNISGYGEFLLMDEFKVQRPKKMTIMVFLFEKIVIFTKRHLDEEAFYYIGSIKMNQVGLVPPHNKNKKILELKDHLTSTKFHKETIFSLEATSEYIQMQWRRAIEKCLWSQLLKAKRECEVRVS